MGSKVEGENMSKVVVRTKEELKIAYAGKVDEIIIEGKLAKQIRDLEKIKLFSPVAIGALTAAGVAFLASTVSGPITGGISYFAAVATLETAAATTGLSVPLIILSCSIGVALLVAIFKEYDMEAVVSGKGIKVILRKR